MTNFDGDVDEMPVHPLDDQALDALLSGAHAESGFDWLIPFVEDLVEATRGSAPPMTPALALLVTEGVSTEKGDVPATVARRVIGRAPQAAGRPRWRSKLVLTGLAAKFTGLGMVAKSGIGLSLVVASTTAAGAVGVLPAPAQHAVATVVGAATPFTFPDPDVHDKNNFGATVSADATGASDGVPGVDGGAVSDAARNKPKPGDATPDGPSGAPPGTLVGPETGSKGLDRAGETPAAGHVPTSVPAGSGGATVPASPPANGLGTANSTPAAGRAPSTVPPVTPAAPAAGAPGSSGPDTAGATPPAGRTPARP